MLYLCCHLASQFDYTPFSLPVSDYHVHCAITFLRLWPVTLQQIMNHIVDTCPLTKFEGGLNLLDEADGDAVIWLESTANAALAK